MSSPSISHQQLADEICAALAEAGDPERAEGQQRYMKSALPFRGVRVPEARKLAQGVVRSHRIDDSAALADLAADLWDNAEYREERYAAQAVLRERSVRANPDVLDLQLRIVREGAWWDHTDEVSRYVSALLDADPAFEHTVREWAADESMWVRRLGIISQLHRKERTDPRLLTDAIDAHLDNPEFFLQKAIGWALRQYARVEPDWVRTVVADRPAMSALARREATKHL